MPNYKKSLLFTLALILSLCMLGGCSDGTPSDTTASPADTSPSNETTPSNEVTPSDETTPSDEVTPSDETTPSDEIVDPPEDYSLTLEIDSTGMEELSPNEYMKDGLFYIRLETYGSILEYAYDEETIVTRIKELEGDGITVISSEFFEEYQSSYPTMKIEYETGANEDTSFCIDMYFATDTNEYRVHTSVPIDYAGEYQEEMIQRLLTVSMVDNWHSQ